MGTRNVFIEVVSKIALPIFLYAIEAWFPVAEKDQQKLEKIIKFAARLSLNNFSRETSYNDMLQQLKWKPVSRIVAERRLTTVKKYLDGKRFIPDYVFPLETEPTNRQSQRLREQSNRMSLKLATFRNQKNKMEEKHSAAQMRILWNFLNEDMVRLTGQQFKSSISNDDFFRSLCENGIIKVTL
jgi:hypothetical protein